jgi:hypothetical protein
MDISLSSGKEKKKKIRGKYLFRRELENLAEDRGQEKGFEADMQNPRHVLHVRYF